MSSGKNVLLGVAASILFYPVQKYLLEWPYPWDIVSTFGVLIVTIGLVALVTKRVPEGREKGTAIMSDVDADRGMKARIDGLEMSQPPSDVLSRVKVKGGNADFEIKDTKL